MRWKIEQRCLLGSTAESHESHKLELPGIGESRSVRALHDLVRRWNPKIVFLIETKSRKNRMERIKNIIGFANGLIVPSVGRSGGISLLWTREINLEVKSYTRFHIDTIILEPNSDYKWRLIGFYGHLETHKRYESWHLLAFLNNQFQRPWLCFGDFNEILSMDEKFGREKSHLAIDGCF